MQNLNSTYLSTNTNTYLNTYTYNYWIYPSRVLLFCTLLYIFSIFSIPHNGHICFPGGSCLCFCNYLHVICGSIKFRFIV